MGEIRFGGVVGRGTHSFPRNPSTVSGGASFITPERTIMRQIENWILEYKQLTDSSSDGSADPLVRHALAEWDRDPEEFIRNQIPVCFNAYVGSVFCEVPGTNWNIGSILALRESDVYECCSSYFADGGTLSGEEGLSLEEVWFLKVFYYKLPLLCMISKGQPRSAGDRIALKISMKSEGIILFLDKLCRQEADATHKIRHYMCGQHKLFPTPALIHDGEVGHHIEIMGWSEEAGKVVYFDPYPSRSLLCRENNAASVAAEPYRHLYYHEDSADFIRLWEVSVEELERVLYAAFLPVKQSFYDILYYPGGIFPFEGG